MINRARKPGMVGCTIWNLEVSFGASQVNMLFIVSNPI